MTARAGRRLRLVHDAGQRRPARAFDCNPYGLTAAELRAEIRRLTERGWMTWEIRARFCPPPSEESNAWESA